MKKTLFSLVVSFTFFATFAQIPAGYYNNATGTGYTLKTQLYNIIKSGHSAVGYTPGVWNAFYTTDDRDDGYVWDIYSNCNFVFGDDQDNGSDPGGECGLYNREHTIPQSLFDTNEPMRSDLHHVYASDKEVNGIRGDLPFGETNNPTYTSGNGSMKGSSSYSGYTGTIFEPTDEFKGDIARSYFYIATRYQDVISTWGSYPMFDGSSDKCLTIWALNLLIEWNQNDPVSQKEIDRNNAIYELQNNRNPYVDHPEWVECVWLNNCGVNINIVAENSFSLSPNPASDYIYVTDNEIISTVVIINGLGQEISRIKSINRQNIELNINEYNSGLYFIKITDVYGKIKVEKFIKQ